LHGSHLAAQPAAGKVGAEDRYPTLRIDTICFVVNRTPKAFSKARTRLIASALFQCGAFSGDVLSSIAPRPDSKGYPKRPF
jgi:hypothetical protein